MLISCTSSDISDNPQKPWFPLVTTAELRDHILGARSISYSWDHQWVGLFSGPIQTPASYCPHSLHTLILAHCATKRDRAGNSCWGRCHCPHCPSFLKLLLLHDILQSESNFLILQMRKQPRGYLIYSRSYSSASCWTRTKTLYRMLPLLYFLSSKDCFHYNRLWNWNSLVVLIC